MAKKDEKSRWDKAIWDKATWSTKDVLNPENWPGWVWFVIGIAVSGGFIVWLFK